MLTRLEARKHSKKLAEFLLLAIVKKASVIAFKKTMGHSTYLCNDEVNQHDARRLGVKTIVTHPRFVKSLDRSGQLIVDYDAILFDHKGETKKLIQKAVKAGIKVIVHTYNGEQLTGLAGVTVVNNLAAAINGGVGFAFVLPMKATAPKVGS